MTTIGAEILASQILREGLKVRFQARGWSMYPFIRDGAILSIEPLGSKKLRKGDILFCCQINQDTEIVLVHRFSGYLPDGRIITRGDNQPKIDPPLTIQQVLGRVQRVEQGNKIRNLDNPLWRLRGLIIVTVFGFKTFFRKIKIGNLE